MHPSILDGALQSLIGFSLNNRDTQGQLELPFALDEINLYRVLSKTGYVIGCKSKKSTPKVSRYDIWLLNEAKDVCVELLGFATRPYTTFPIRNPVARSLDATSSPQDRLSYLIPEWQNAVVAEAAKTEPTGIVFAWKK